MSSMPDLPTPITPDPADMPVEPDQGPGEMPVDPAAPAVLFKIKSKCATAHFAANRSFMRAAAFCWPVKRGASLATVG